MTMTMTKMLLVLALGTACTGVLGDSAAGGGDGGGSGLDGGLGDGGLPSDPLIGAGDRDLTAYWTPIDVPYGDNVKVLAYDMLQNEVQRATGRSWLDAGVDQWAPNRTVLGGADYVTNWTEDRNVSQQKIVTIRKMAFSVCGDVVAAEAGQPTRTVFAGLDPASTIDAADPAVAAQVRAVYARFFLVDADDAEVTDALTLLTDVQTLATPREAWRGLCAAYLSSMRFLTY